MKHDIPKLEKKLRTLSSSWKELNDDNGFSELFKIIHFPGYTTPAEFRLVNGLADSAQAVTQLLVNMKKELITSSHAIIEEKVHA
jgi:hypothetical protein